MEDLQTKSRAGIAGQARRRAARARAARRRALRLFIDHPDGVDLGLCERVTAQLRDLLEEWALEVSSPGPERPLTKPEHFRRFIGRRVRVRTSEEIEGRSNFTGRIAGADERRSGRPRRRRRDHPAERIRRSNLVPESPEGATS